MHAGVERIGTMRCGVGESPVWHPREQALYWTDIPGRTLWRWNPATGHADAWPLPEMAGCIAMLDDGWALAMETGVFRIPQLEAGLPVPAPRQLAPVQHARPDMRFNDGRCDRQGRFWSGTMVLDTTLGVPAGKLYRLDSRAGRVEAVAGDLIVPNGLAFSPDGRTLYLSDSHVSRQAVWAFDYDIDTGTRTTAACSSTCMPTPAAPTAPRWMPTAATGSAATMRASCTASRRRAGSTAACPCRWPSPRCARSAGPAWTRCS